MGAYTVPAAALSMFVCPRCSDGALGDRSSELVCGRCSARYPVLDGIPRFVDEEHYCGSFGYQWDLHRTTQLDSCTGLPLSRMRLEAATNWGRRSLAGQTVLEAGSGAGRFTEILAATGADVFSFDLSRAVESNAGNKAGTSGVTFFQGDIFNIPFGDSCFDHVLCLGVLQHTPDPESAFMHLSRKVKPGGCIYVDVYELNWRSYLQWKYLLRPMTRRMNEQTLYRLVSGAVDLLLPAARLARRHLGSLGGRLAPIAHYPHLGLDPQLEREWAVLDTFDWYAPAHDRPQSLANVKSWFRKADFTEVSVWRGYNGVMGRGRRGHRPGQ